MSSRGVTRLGGCVLAACLTVAGDATTARAQGWSLEVSTGRIVYDPIAAAAGTSNLLGTIRYTAPAPASVYVTGAAPLRDGDPTWTAGGGAGRLMMPAARVRRVSGGVDLGADAFLFRDPVAAQTGSGGTLDALPFVRISSGAASVEARGGWRGYAISQGGAVTRRGVIETGARAAYHGAFQANADFRIVHASDGRYPFLGGSLGYAGPRGHVWAVAGRWLDAVLDEVTWGAGGGLALGPRATLWASVRQEGPDPLYWNASRRTWSIGVTRRLGRVSGILQPATRTAGGDVIIRLPAADAPRGRPSIAGDFNNWQPVPMEPDGRDWVIRLPLTPGVYNYAFRAADGDWFVPVSVAGRRSDGMGGHLAVLVVPG